MQVSEIPAHQDTEWLPFAEWHRMHENLLTAKTEALTRQPAPELVFIGDSITAEWLFTGRPVWDTFFGSHNPVNSGIGGDHTEHVLWRIEDGALDGLAPKVAVILIGTNNIGGAQHTSEVAASGVARVVGETANRLPDAQILLLGILPRDELAGDLLRVKATEANTLIAPLGGRERVEFLDITPVFLEPDGRIDTAVMHDFLHLSEEGYRRLAEGISGALEPLLA